MTKKNRAGELATKLKISQSRALESVIKAQLIAAVAKAAKRRR